MVEFGEEGPHQGNEGNEEAGEPWGPRLNFGAFAWIWLALSRILDTRGEGLKAGGSGRQPQGRNEC